MSTKPLTVRQFFKLFPDDETCLEHLFNVRFGQGYTCPNPKCGRPSNWYRIKAERAYSCQWCGNHLHPTVGTPFEQTRTPLQLWFYAIFMFTTTRNGVSAKELQRQLGVTYKTAWRMGHEIRKHMAEVDGCDLIGGEGKVVEIDETLVGGIARGLGQGRQLGNKTFVLGMVERGGDVVTVVVPDCRRETLWPLIESNVVKGTTLNTDELKSYFGLQLRGYRHQTVNHKAGEYVSPFGCTTASIESFWAILKRGIAGTHIYVSGKHLAKYAKEFEYRFNRRGHDEVMLGELLTTFRPLR